MNDSAMNVTRIALLAVALAAGCRYATVDEGDGAVSRDMQYAALDGSGEWKAVAGGCVSADGGPEWFACDDGESFTNAVGEKISLMQFCRLVYSEGARAADSWLAAQATRCDTACEASFNSRIVEKCIGPILEGETLEEELAKYSLWSLGDDLYLVKTEEPGGAMGMHMYWFAMADVDADVIKVLLVFDHLPESEWEIESLKQARTNPAALNNIAAMVFNHVAWHHSISTDYIEKLLLIAAAAGEPTACRNLATLHSGDPYGYKRDEEKMADWRARAAACARARKQGRRPKMAPLAIADWPKMSP